MLKIEKNLIGLYGTEGPFSRGQGLFVFVMAKYGGMTDVLWLLILLYIMTYLYRLVVIFCGLEVI